MLTEKNRLRFIVAVSFSVVMALFFLPAKGFGQEDADEAPAAEIDYKKLKSPVAYTKKSIARGKLLYVRLCTECHGPDGKALLDVVADATDLTTPEYWLSGSTEGEVFRSIRNGAGDTMPPFSFHIKKEEEFWHLVNFVRSLWPESRRPKLQKESEKTDGAKEGAGTVQKETRGGNGDEG